MASRGLAGLRSTRLDGRSHRHEDGVPRRVPMDDDEANMFARPIASV